MTTHNLARSIPLAVAAFLVCAALPARAQTVPAKKPAPAKVVKKAPVKAAPREPAPPAAATPEQAEAAEHVYYGAYDCEFKQTIDIVASQKYPSYVDVKHGKADYLMKPVLSSTGAIRLEDVRGDTLMVQISSKSMLLNVKTAQRIVDDCVSPKQRELIEAARVAKVAATAASAAPPATAASAAPPATAASAAPPATAASAAPPASPASAASAAPSATAASAASAPVAVPVSLPASAPPAMTTAAPTAPTR